MKSALIFVCSVLATQQAFAQEPNRLTPAERQAGWQLLFDGHSMDGWQDPRRKIPPGDAWTIENGCLKAVPQPHLTEDLLTRETFRDFELLFDWKIAPGSNSGVKYRIQDVVILTAEPVHPFEALVNFSVAHRQPRRAIGQEYVVGFEYQLIDDKLNEDARRGAIHQTGALYDMMPPVRAASRPVGEFNHARLIVRGSHVEHWLNGVKVLEASLGGPEIAAHSAHRWGAGSPIYELLVKQPHHDCPISLQNHDAAAWFRNLKIRRLR